MTLTTSDLTKIGQLIDDKLEAKLEPIKQKLDEKPSRKEVSLMIDQQLVPIIKRLDEKPSRKEVSLMIDQKLEPVITKISHLPTKKEFYAKMDKWMKAADTSNLEKASHIFEHNRITQFIKLHATQ
jgi:histidyl-tRNA synthetase